MNQNVRTKNSSNNLYQKSMMFTQNRNQHQSTRDRNNSETSSLHGNLNTPGPNTTNYYPAQNLVIREESRTPSYISDISNINGIDGSFNITESNREFTVRNEIKTHRIEETYQFLDGVNQKNSNNVLLAGGPDSQSEDAGQHGSSFIADVLAGRRDPMDKSMLRKDEIVIHEVNSDS